MGMLYKESLEFEVAIDFFRKSLKVDKAEQPSTITMRNLASTLARTRCVSLRVFSPPSEVYSAVGRGRSAHAMYDTSPSAGAYALSALRVSRRRFP